MDVNNEERDTGKTALERLRSELDEVKDQLAATSEVLTAIGRSASESMPFSAPSSTAPAGCAAPTWRRSTWSKASILSLPGRRGCPRLASTSWRGTRWDPIGSRSSGGSRSTAETQQITDVLADPEYGRLDVQRLAGLRTVLGVPMLLEDEVVGVLVVWRIEVDPFSDGRPRC